MTIDYDHLNDVLVLDFSAHDGRVVVRELSGVRLHYNQSGLICRIEIENGSETDAELRDQLEEPAEVVNAVEYV